MRRIRLTFGAVSFFAAGFLLGRVSNEPTTSAPANDSTHETAPRPLPAVDAARPGVDEEAGLERTSSGPSTIASASSEQATVDASASALSLLEAPAVESSSAPAAARARAGGARRRPSPPRDSVETDPLKEALRYLRRAQLALRERDGRGALAVLDEMDRRIPESLLSEERQMTRVLALCERGSPASARALARRLLSEHPDSVYVTRLQNTCVPDVAADALESLRRRTP